MGLLRNLEIMLGGIVTRTVDSALFNWIEAVSLFLDGENPVMAQLNWYIDPVNGSDSNSGATASAPLKTDGERQRRMGRNPIWNGGQLLPTTSAVYNIYYLNDLPVSDAVIFEGSRARNVSIFLHGSTTPGNGQSILFSGTVNALDTLDRTAGVNRSWQITANALPATWNGLGLIGKRIRMTSGASLGAKSFAIKDLGAKKARQCQFLAKNTYTQPFTLSTTVAGPALNDTFVVEKLTHIPLFLWTISNIDDAFFNSTFQPFVVESLEIGTGGDMILNGADSIIFDGCIVALFETVGSGYVTMGSCRQTESSLSGGWASWGIFAGYSDTQGNWGLGSVPFIIIDKDFMMQGASLTIQSFLQISDIASFDSPTDGFVVASQRVQFFKTIWGQGAGGSGIRMLANNSASYALATTVFNIASTGQNLMFGARTSVERFDPAGPAFTAAIATSFANLAAALPGGFGGHIVDNVANTAFVSF